MPRTAKAKVNRSQAIRDYLTKNPKANLVEVRETLATDGIKVSDSLINAVKYKKPKGKRGKKRGRPAKARATSTPTFSAATLIAAKKMVDDLGGVERAVAAIEVLKLLAK